MSNVVRLPVFTNEHLSVSRIKRFDQCPLAFFYQYVEKPEASLEDPDREAADFGNVLHDALERTYQWVMDNEYEGPFPVDELLEFFRLAWTDASLTGIALYQEGREILRRYASWSGPVDHMRTLAVEREFNLLVGPEGSRIIDASEKAKWQHVGTHFVVNGYIDRIDRIDSETVEIIDYKSGRLLFTREELATDLQMSIYKLAAQDLFPWAKEVRLAFHMLRHGMRQTTSRSADDLQAARDYVLAVGTRSEKNQYKPKLNTYCGTCDHRVRCDTYKAAVERKLEVVAVSEKDLDALAIERERVAAIAKAAYARKERLDGILRNAVGELESREMGGATYRILQYFDTGYPMPELLALFREAGVDPTAALTVDNKALDALLGRVEADETIPRTIRDFLRVRVAAKSVKIPQKPRLDARSTKKKA